MKSPLCCLVLLPLLSGVSLADTLYCPQPSQITQEKMVNNVWYYTATVNTHTFAQFGGINMTKGPDITTFANTTIFPYSGYFPGTMQCNYTASDGTTVTLWFNGHAKPSWDANNDWIDPLHNGVYPCHSSLINNCPAVIVS